MTSSNEFITIVSGLPRSGTSMMMRMLEAGGMQPLKDDIREADESNPRGYYEYEGAKKIREDSSWLGKASGKAVKIVSRLLYDLPGEKHYKVIFMRRSMDEILSSQRQMIERLGEERREKMDDSGMAALFHAHLAHLTGWLAHRPNVDVLEVDYNQLLADPHPILQRVNTFLGHTLDTGKMAMVIDPSLYRERR